jgi:hypothetical protein
MKVIGFFFESLELAVPYPFYSISSIYLTIEIEIPRSVLTNKCVSAHKRPLCENISAWVRL